MRVEGGAEAAEELSGTGNDELSAASAPLVGGDAGDVFARNTPREGDGDNVMRAKITAGVGQNRLQGGNGNDGLTADGASGNILSGGTGDDKISGSEGNDTFVLDLRRLTADETLDTINGFDPAVDRLAFFGLTDAGAPLGGVGTCHCLEPITA